jgi:hypothetical protein
MIINNLGKLRKIMNEIHDACNSTNPSTSSEDGAEIYMEHRREDNLIIMVRQFDITKHSHSKKANKLNDED